MQRFMEAKDLRIGNYIWEYVGKEHDEELKQVYKVEEDAVNGLIPQAIRPVTLTEEWLNRKPCETKEWKGNGQDYQPETSKTNQRLYRLFEEVCLVFQTWSWRNEETDEWKNEDSIFLSHFGNEIDLYKYEVHVLQNLYHSLTGTELEIKEDEGWTEADDLAELEQMEIREQDES